MAARGRQGWARVAAGLAALPAAGAVQAEPMPPAVAAMIEAAAANPDELKVVADIARRTNPASAAEIDARVAEIEAERTRQREAQLASQAFFEGWSGQGEAGGFVSTGNTQNRGAAVGINLTKNSLRFKHALRGIVDYQEDRGIVSRERYFAGYEGNWKFNRRGFLVLALSWEQDRFTGFSSRFTQALGIGYRLFDTAALSIAIDGGPALRQTRFVTGVNETAVAARLALNGKWVIAPRLTLTQTTSYYADNVNSSLLALTQLTAKLNGRLSARLSYQANNEANPPPGLLNNDTVTRATLVYNF